MKVGLTKFDEMISEGVLEIKMKETKLAEKKGFWKKDQTPKGGSYSSKMTGARFIAETFKGYGVTHVFYVEAILRRALVEKEELGIRRVLTH